MRHSTCSITDWGKEEKFWQPCQRVFRGDFAPFFIVIVQLVSAKESYIYFQLFFRCVVACLAWCAAITVVLEVRFFACHLSPQLKKCTSASWPPRCFTSGPFACASALTRLMQRVDGGIFKNYHKNFRLQIRQKQEMFFGDTYDMTSCARRSLARRLVILQKSSYLNHVPRKLSHDLG